MKKFFKFAALAALVLPLVVACKPKNDPDAPKDPDEEYQEWLDKGSENEVTVSEKNLCGIWQLFRTYAADSEQNYVGSQNYDEGNYLELSEDHTFVDYIRNVNSGNSAILQGTWDLLGKKVTIKYNADNVLPGGERSTLEEAFSGRINDYMVFRCEPEELALSFTSQGHLYTKDWKDSIGTITTFILFKRLYELPNIPKPLDKVVIGTPWKVLSDTMYLGKYNWVQDNSFMGSVYQPVKVEQTDMLPQNAVITFAPDSTVEVKAANGDLIGKAWYQIRSINPRSYLSTESHLEMWIDLEDENGGRPFDGSELIPGLPNSLNIFIDPSNAKRIIMHEEQPLPESEQKDGLTLRGWIYHLEAAK